ncbi:hypothetical protein Y5W_02050 [Alcanivorax sp. 521-1]|uniref:Uncharacterized protein n=1 Tax=Alloalcanivorax profundimaris TaxID=2735259 RepID=A0ABS0ARM8_9GAMM|nr:hypothetical protein [Alloalcanivorax profundimaris]
MLWVAANSQIALDEPVLGIHFADRAITGIADQKGLAVVGLHQIVGGRPRRHSFDQLTGIQIHNADTATGRMRGNGIATVGSHQHMVHRPRHFQFAVNRLCGRVHQIEQPGTPCFQFSRLPAPMMSGVFIF